MTENDLHFVLVLGSTYRNVRLSRLTK